jgi:hypothetical protein
MKFFKELISDENKINEKSFVGFTSFAIMVLFALTDIITSIIGNAELKVSNTIYNSFVYVTLGSFGISELKNIVQKGKSKE